MKKYVQYKNFSRGNPIEVRYRNGKTQIGIMKQIVVKPNDYGIAEIIEIEVPDTGAILRAPLDRAKQVEV